MDWTTLATAASAVLVAIVSGLATVRANKKKAQSEVQTVLNNGFSTLVDELKSERTELMRIIREHQVENSRLGKEINSRDQELTRCRNELDWFKRRRGV
jgi:uncharacterized protein HemX